MINNFSCINMASKDSKRLVSFYKDILGIPVLYEDVSQYDGVGFGFIKGAPAFCIWDETRWGTARSSQGPVCLVFHCDDHDKTYQELKDKGVPVEPPKVVSWDVTRKELLFKDPDGNTIFIL